MSNLDVNQMLAQMRVMATAAVGSAEPTQTAQAVQGGDKPDFSKMLAESIESVSETQMEAGNLKKSFEAGEPGTELPEVMVAVQKANLSFQAMTQVRNKLLSAYQEVMNMQV